MPLRTMPDGTHTLVPMDDPAASQVPQPLSETPDWLDRWCAALGREVSLTIRSWGQLKYNFLSAMYDSAKHGNCPSTPTADDIAQALSRELTAPDEASKAALRSWVEVLAKEAVERIDSAKETVRINAEREAERARQYAEEQRIKNERQALMERSEFDRQAVLAQEAEARKWAAFEAQKAEFEAFKARTTTPAEATA